MQPSASVILEHHWQILIKILLHVIKTTDSKRATSTYYDWNEVEQTSANSVIKKFILNDDQLKNFFFWNEDTAIKQVAFNNGLFN